jgi:hypothetical protein
LPDTGKKIKDKIIAGPCPWRQGGYMPKKQIDEKEGKSV